MNATNNKAVKEGGAIYIEGYYKDTFTTIDDYYLENNKAINGSAISIHGDSVNVTNSIVLNNTAVNGAVYVWGDYVILENSTYANNTAIDGAGLYIYGDYTEFNNVTVVHNIASNNGGGIFLNGDHVLINSVIGHLHYLHCFFHNFFRQTFVVHT